VTFIVYALWQLIVLGIMPLTGPYSLIDALEAGSPVTQFLRSHVNSDLLGLLADYFAFFALVTSFLGIGLGLFDFLSDGLNLQKTGWQSLILGFLVMVPTFVFATYFERIFLVALETTGGFGDTILNGMMPVLMVWIGRYYLHFPKENRLPGGKLFLGFVFLLFLTALILELLLKIGAICSIMNYCQALQKDYLL
jgi:tyrosine-specific transport protein